MILLVVYALGLILLGWLDSRKVLNFSDYVLAGRRRGGAIVAASLLASVVGASATIGVVDMAYRVGMPAFWWLGSGAIGLIIMGLTIAKKLVSYDIYTLADLVEKLNGVAARWLVSVVVVVVWTGIVGAQYVAAAEIVSQISGWSYHTSLVVAGLFVTAYCALGGQASVMKTDFLQVILMALGIGMSLHFLFYSTGMPQGGIDLSLFNSDFGFSKWSYFMLIVGTGFIVGPDVFSRIFTAKGPKEARFGALASGVLLIVFSLTIVMIGVWAKYFIVVPEGQKALIYILSNSLPNWLGFLLLFGILSAIVSSADTCLITSSTTFEHDIICGTNVSRARILTVVLGFIAIAAVWENKDIIKILLFSYSVFNSGVIPPLLLSILVSHTRRMNVVITSLAILSGASLGAYSGVVDDSSYAMIGMGVSAALSIIGAIFGERVDSSVVPLRDE